MQPKSEKIFLITVYGTSFFFAALPLVLEITFDVQIYSTIQGGTVIVFGGGGGGGGIVVVVVVVVFAVLFCFVCFLFLFLFSFLFLFLRSVSGFRKHMHKY